MMLAAKFVDDACERSLLMMLGEPAFSVDYLRVKRRTKKRNKYQSTTLLSRYDC
jgi:hypothetical protein